ncbi:hypothetical protein [Streptomyces spinosus]|uniref:hypothetical protein n=1 Tax=Streptomyces spinosus TaxID=2872623 RepID=UPI001CEC1E26|nr:hypothetical protein [Streptomyces spinosus]
MAGNGQQSSEQATRNGIQALEMAFSGILRSRQDVEATRNSLATGYQGTDGKKFGDLVHEWEKQVDIVLRNLEGMIDKLNTSLSEHQKVQGSANEDINAAYQQSEAIFDQLTGAA